MFHKWKWKTATSVVPWCCVSLFLQVASPKLWVGYMHFLFSTGCNKISSGVCNSYWVCAIDEMYLLIPLIWCIYIYIYIYFFFFYWNHFMFYIIVVEHGSARKIVPIKFEPQNILCGWDKFHHSFCQIRTLSLQFFNFSHKN